MGKTLSLYRSTRVSLFSALLLFSQCRRHSVTPAHQGWLISSSTDQVSVVSDSQLSEIPGRAEQLVEWSERLEPLSELSTRITWEQLRECEGPLKRWVEWTEQLAEWAELPGQQVRAKTLELEKLAEQLAVRTGSVMELAQWVGVRAAELSTWLTGENAKAQAKKLGKEAGKLKEQAKELRIQVNKLGNQLRIMLASEDAQPCNWEGQFEEWIGRLAASARELKVLARELEILVQQVV